LVLSCLSILEISFFPFIMWRLFWMWFRLILRTDLKVCTSTVFWWEWGLNSGPQARKAGFWSTAPVCFAPVIWRWEGVLNCLPGLAWNRDPPKQLGLQATGVSHPRPALFWKAFINWAEQWFGT
jgi:hypothetical protein